MVTLKIKMKGEIGESNGILMVTSKQQVTGTVRTKKSITLAED